MESFKNHIVSFLQSSSKSYKTIFTCPKKPKLIFSHRKKIFDCSHQLYTVEKIIGCAQNRKLHPSSPTMTALVLDAFSCLTHIHEHSELAKKLCKL